MRILFVRHGETEWNHIHRIQGQTDVPLNETGLAQAQKVGQRLANTPSIAAIYASDLSRAWVTAEAIAAHHPDVPLQPDTRLREYNFGSFEGEMYDDFTDEQKERWANWRLSKEEVHLESVEDRSAMAQRAGGFLADLQERHKPETDDTVLVVAHGGSIRTLICLAMEFHLQNVWRIDTWNTSISEISITPKVTRLIRLNDTRHLD